MSRRRASSPIGPRASPPGRAGPAGARRGDGGLLVIDSTVPKPRGAACQHLRMRRYGPPLVLMALIFFLSAQPDLNSGLGVWDTIGRKLIHAATYGVLFLLWWRALGRTWPAVAVTLLYAISDEYHQTFVHGRHGSPLDVAIDMAGVPIAVGGIPPGTPAGRGPPTRGAPPAEARRP